MDFCIAQVLTLPIWVIVGCCGEYRDQTLNGLEGIAHDVESLSRVLLEYEDAIQPYSTLIDRFGTREF